MYKSTLIQPLALYLSLSTAGRCWEAWGSWPLRAWPTALRKPLREQVRGQGFLAARKLRADFSGSVESRHEPWGRLRLRPIRKLGSVVPPGDSRVGGTKAGVIFQSRATGQAASLLGTCSMT